VVLQLGPWARGCQLFVAENRSSELVGFFGKMDMHLGQDRNQWRALVNMVMNLRVP
jgi:hypothetical protein